MRNIDYKRINIYELLICLTNAGDLVSPQLADHHQKVAYLSFRISEQLNISREEQRKVTLAGLLHDVGALSLSERLELIEDESINASNHAERGALLLEEYPPLSDLSGIIRHHHVRWDNGEGMVHNGREVSILSHIVHLADRIAVLIDPNKEIIGQIKAIKDTILKENNRTFVPELVDAFIKVSAEEYIWLDTMYKPLLYILPDIVVFDSIELNQKNVIDLVKIFAKIIDFRSPFTANHSTGVAKSAQKLAEYAGLSKNECDMMLIAGYLHDFGKLAISNEVLEKPSKLTVEEYNAIKSHTFYTYRLLQSIKEFETINEWASFHHEKLNGKGYPFHMDEERLSLGSRIMAVADVFTAIMEDRPYRKSMDQEDAKSILKSMVENRSLCPYVVSLLMENFDTINDVRKEAQQQASLEYNYFLEVSG